jgi:fructose-bisphosphate aldolase, class I
VNLLTTGNMEVLKMRPKLAELDLSLGKRTRLHRLLYQYGLKNGILMLLPIDQGLEHGPIDFLPNPASADPDFQWKLAEAGNYNGIALHYGLAYKYMKNYAGKVPLILKVNGKTNIPSDDLALSPLTGTVEDAVRLGADAVGYTLYVGSPLQDQDLQQLMEVRSECDRLGMPLIVWSYPRGAAIEEKGGKDSFYAVDYAARVADEVGADIVKLNMPKPCKGDECSCPKQYHALNKTMSVEEMTKAVVKSAGKTMVLFSGGSKLDDKDVIEKVKLGMDAGATGMIFGRNMWQRKWDDALAMTAKVKDILAKYGN